jgi:hypothetical protein
VCREYKVDIASIAYNNWHMVYVAPDQVPRRIAFEREHPEWKITTERMGWVWKAQRDGSETLITANDLRDLLDELERRFTNSVKPQPTTPTAPGNTQ